MENLSLEIICEQVNWNMPGHTFVFTPLPYHHVAVNWIADGILLSFHSTFAANFLKLTSIQPIQLPSVVQSHEILDLFEWPLEEQRPMNAWIFGLVQTEDGLL